MKSQLEHFVTKICLEAKKVYPQAIVRVSYQPLDDEDAIVRIHVPSEEMELVDQAVHRLTYDILVEEGYHIVALVYARPEVPSAVVAA